MNNLGITRSWMSSTFVGVFCEEPFVGEGCVWTAVTDERWTDLVCESGLLDNSTYMVFQTAYIQCDWNKPNENECCIQWDTELTKTRLQKVWLYFHERGMQGQFLPVQFCCCLSQQYDCCWLVIMPFCSLWDRNTLRMSVGVELERLISFVTWHSVDSIQLKKLMLQLSY